MSETSWNGRILRMLAWAAVVCLGAIGVYAIRHDGNVGVAFLIAALVLAAPAARLSEKGAPAESASLIDRD